MQFVFRWLHTKHRKHMTIEREAETRTMVGSSCLKANTQTMVEWVQWSVSRPSCSCFNSNIMKHTHMFLETILSEILIFATLNQLARELWSVSFIRSWYELNSFDSTQHWLTVKSPIRRGTRRNLGVGLPQENAQITRHNRVHAVIISL
jgi:hypothetical protein